MKKILYILLVIVTQQVYGQDVKKQIEANNAEIKKLVLATPGAQKLIDDMKALQNKVQAARSPELQKRYQEYRELALKSCIAEKSNPDVQKMVKRQMELSKISEDLTKSEQAQIEKLRQERSTSGIGFRVPGTVLTEDQKKIMADYRKQIFELEKKIAEKTTAQTKEIDGLNKKIKKITATNKLGDAAQKIWDLEMKSPGLIEDSKKMVRLHFEISDMFENQRAKIAELRKKDDDLYKQLSPEEQCAVSNQIFDPNTIVIWGINFSAP